MEKDIISSDRSISFTVKCDSENAIRSTIYRLAGEVFLDFENKKGVYNISCRLKDEHSEEFSDITRIENIFKETLNDEVLRERIREETKDYRSLIIATAFSGILENESK
ncbi:His-Xaa-Ser system protein HxsD [bacterium]|nr:His-Xaa-Ser system protein HxsD [bacterium]